MFLRFIFILPLAPFLCLAENHRGPASSWSHSAASYVPASESQFGGGEAEDTCYIWVNRQRWRDASLWALSAEQPRLLKQNFNDEWLVTTWKCCCCGYWLASCEGWLLSGAAFSRLPLQRSAISMNKKKKKASAAFAYGDLGMMCMWGLLSWTLWHYEEVWRVKGSNTHMFMKTALQPCPTCHCVCVCVWLSGFGTRLGWARLPEACRLTAMTVRESHFVWHVLLCDGLYSTFMFMCTWMDISLFSW